MNTLKIVKQTFQIIFYLFFITISSSAQSDIELNCYTIVVGKNASENGSLLVAHNEDDFGKQIVNLHKVPRLEHNQDSYIKLNNGGSVEQTKRTNGFLWLELPGMKVADSFINDKGVVVASNGCPSVEDKPDSTDGGILYWFRRLVAERAESAKHAVNIAGELVDKFGYVSSGRSYTFADKNEAWIFAAVYGKHWIAQRVPDDEVVVIPNYYTIKEINLIDTLNFKGSPDLIKYAEKRGWYNSETDGEFNFANVYTAKNSIKHPGNVNRMWRGVNLLSKEKYDLDDDFPFSFVPYKKLNINDIKLVLRDHYEECELDKSEMYKKGNPHKINNATICSQSTQYSFIAELRDNMPIEIGTKVWLTFYRPGINIFAPIYLGTNHISEEFSLTDYKTATELHLDPPETTFDTTDTHAYWKFVKAVNKLEGNFGTSYEKIVHKNNLIERKIIKENVLFEEEILKIAKNDIKRALKLLSEYSNENLKKILDRAKEICN